MSNQTELVENRVAKICLFCRHADLGRGDIQGTEIFCLKHQQKYDDHDTCDRWQSLIGLREVVFIPKRKGG